MHKQNIAINKQVQDISSTLQNIKNNYLEKALSQTIDEKDTKKLKENFDFVYKTINKLSNNTHMQAKDNKTLIKNLKKRITAFKGILLEVPEDVEESYEEGIYSMLALNSISEKMNFELIKLKNITRLLLNNKIIFIKKMLENDIQNILVIGILIILIIGTSSHFLHNEIMKSILIIKDINKSFLMFVQQKSKDIKKVKYFPNDEIGEILKDTEHNMHLVKNLIMKERELTKKTYFTLGENIKLNKEIVQTQKEIIFTMGTIGESRSKETGNHVKRVAAYSYILAKLYGLSEEEATLIKEASPMHDIGKVAIPDSILNKPAKLTKEEFKIMKSHAQLGYDMLKHSDRPILKTAAIIALQHHEKYNGKGYPRGLKGEDIHIYGAISAIADVFDALGSDRCYKKAWSIQKIINLIIEETGEHFHPVLANLFLANLDKFLEVRDKFKDEIVAKEISTVD